jgi:photosystem II stability/assembly factor-like uncharacterized protein
MDSRKLLITRNYGANWELKTFPVAVSSLAVDPQNQLWVIGVNGGIYSTHDNGESWNEFKLSVSQTEGIEWHSIAFSDRGVGIAVGDRGHIAINNGNGIWRVECLGNTDEDLYDVQIHGTRMVILGEVNILISNISDS